MRHDKHIHTFEFSVISLTVSRPDKIQPSFDESKYNPGFTLSFLIQ